jgi:hypothetical protein
MSKNTHHWWDDVLAVIVGLMFGVGMHSWMVGVAVALIYFRVCVVERKLERFSSIVAGGIDTVIAKQNEGQKH